MPCLESPIVWIRILYVWTLVFFFVSIDPCLTQSHLRLDLHPPVRWSWQRIRSMRIGNSKTGSKLCVPTRHSYNVHDRLEKYLDSIIQYFILFTCMISLRTAQFGILGWHPQETKLRSVINVNATTISGDTSPEESPFLRCIHHNSSLPCFMSRQLFNRLFSIHKNKFDPCDWGVSSWIWRTYISWNSTNYQTTRQ